MNDEQLLRYARHIQLNDMDIQGQAAINQSRVLIIGVGGLGAPAAMYLAASGVGGMTLVDDDVVSLSNLQRQILFTTPDIGRRKVDVAQETLTRMNPNVRIQAVAQRADAALLAQLIGQADVVLDCSDNFATRHAVNQACVQQQKPLVSGAAIRFSGQVGVFDMRLRDSACYACLFAPNEQLADEACATLGVFAPLVGIIGAMQAAETLKIIAKIGGVLTGRLLSLDVKSMQWQMLCLSKNPQCLVCAAH